VLGVRLLSDSSCLPPFFCLPLQCLIYSFCLCAQIFSHWTSAPLASWNDYALTLMRKLRHMSVPSWRMKPDMAELAVYGA
jgi:hypothetical protein